MGMLTLMVIITDVIGEKDLEAYPQGPCGFGCLQGGVWEGGQCAGGNMY